MNYLTSSEKLIVLRTLLKKRKLDGLRITLISKNYNTTYSGMVPGYIEGIYEWDEINIDLIQLSITFSLLKVTITIVKVCLDIDI